MQNVTWDSSVLVTSRVLKDPKQITVVEFCQENPAIAASEHPVGRRYKTLFGEIEWHAGGLNQWLDGLP
jgi:hypothetical protein